MKTLRYFLLNGIFAVSIYYGLWEKIDGYLNVALFIGWFTAATSIFFLRKSFIESIADKLINPTVPNWFDISFDIGVVFSFIYNSYFWLGGAYLFHIIVLSGARQMAKEIVGKRRELQ